MKLSECFERIETEEWAKHININAMLFNPGELGIDYSEESESWVKRILGVYSGRVTFESICTNHILNGNILE